MSAPHIKRWHDYLKSPEPGQLEAQIHEDAVFISPVVHTPQRGKMMTMAYLSAAAHVFDPETFRYVREFDCGNRAVLEFECDMDGIHVNGVDMIEWDEDGLITEFKVMVRPLKAIQLIHAKMGAMLAKMKG